MQGQLREDTGLFLRQAKGWYYVQWTRCPLLGLVEERDVSREGAGERGEENCLLETPTSQRRPDQHLHVRYIRSSWSSKKLAFFRNWAVNGQAGSCCWTWHECCLLSLGAGSWDGHVNSRGGKESVGAGDLHKTCLNMTAAKPLISSQTEEIFCAIHLWE